MEALEQAETEEQTVLETKMRAMTIRSGRRSPTA